MHMKCIYPLAEYASNNSQRLLEEPAIEFVVRRVLQRTVDDLIHLRLLTKVIVAEMMTKLPPSSELIDHL